MTKLQATLMSLTLIGSFAVMPARAQTDATKTGNSAIVPSPSPNPKQSPRQQRTHVAHAPGAAQQSAQSKAAQREAKPQGKEPDGMQGMEGMQQETTHPA